MAIYPRQPIPKQARSGFELQRVRLVPGLNFSESLGSHLGLELAMPWPMLPSSSFLPLQTI
jgi:hypothetical protein